mmetsp:Transcript_4119/g.6973  ORF Transcript_4119/g.6973 Transcript_4119/m.6973 type:complete len:200 (+) Transcript_4119:339-938(+)
MREMELEKSGPRAVQQFGFVDSDINQNSELQSLQEDHDMAEREVDRLSSPSSLLRGSCMRNEIRSDSNGEPSQAEDDKGMEARAHSSNDLGAISRAMTNKSGMLSPLSRESAAGLLCNSKTGCNGPSKPHSPPRASLQLRSPSKQTERVPEDELMFREENIGAAEGICVLSEKLNQRAQEELKITAQVSFQEQISQQAF